MTMDPLNIIKFDFLYSKSSDCIKLALHRRSTESPHPGERGLRDLFGQEKAVNHTEYQLWASIAMELLGKAALAKQHPCFVADPRGPDSMLAAAGLGSRLDGTSIEMGRIKTISATEVYRRLKGLVPGYDEDAHDFCSAIAASRNAELHTAASPTFHLEPRLGPDWEGKYWNTCEIILSHIGYSFDNWLGEENAEEAIRVIDKTSKAREKKQGDVATRIAMARQEYDKLNETRRSEIENELNSIDLNTIHNRFTRTYEKVWEVICPSCESRSFMAGIETASSLMDTTEVVDGEIRRVKHFGRIFAPYEFVCPACDLKLSDTDEIRFANMYETYQE